MLLWILSLFCAAILVIFAYYMYPVLDGDSIAFVPAIKTYGATGVLENRLLDLAYITDPERQGRFVFYTPGFPLFFGSLLSFFRGQSYQSIVILLSLARASSVFIFTKSVIIVLERDRRLSSAYFLFLGSALVISNAFFLFASNGRPEILSMLIVSLGIFAALSIKMDTRRHLGIQGCIGLLLPVSIANTAIGLSFYLFYLFFDIKSIRRRLIFFSIAASFAAFCLVVSYSLAGVPLWDGFQGLALHSTIQLDRDDTQLRLVLSSYNWVVFGLLSIAKVTDDCFNSLRARGASRIDLVWIVASFAILAFFVYFFWLRTPRTRYNFYAFLPLYQLLCLQLVLRASRRGARILKFLLGGIVLSGVLLSLIIPMRIALLFPYYLTSGNAYHEMKYQFSRVDVDGCAVVHTNAIAFLDDTQSGSNYIIDDSRQVIPSERIKADLDTNSCIVAFVQEVNSNAEPPANMELIADFGDRSPYTELLQSIRLLNSPKGYSFYAYKGEFVMDQEW